jgi:hypothetical protein
MSESHNIQNNDKQARFLSVSISKATVEHENPEQKLFFFSLHPPYFWNVIKQKFRRDTQGEAWLEMRGKVTMLLILQTWWWCEEMKDVMN